MMNQFKFEPLSRGTPFTPYLHKYFSFIFYIAHSFLYFIKLHSYNMLHHVFLPLPYFYHSILCNFYFLNEVKWYLILVLIYTIPMINGVESFLHYFTWPYTYLLRNIHPGVFVHLIISLFSYHLKVWILMFFGPQFYFIYGLWIYLCIPI